MLANDPKDFHRKEEVRYQHLDWIITFIFIAAAVMGVALAGALFTLVVFAIRYFIR